jgi:hypothetical protein
MRMFAYQKIANGGKMREKILAIVSVLALMLGLMGGAMSVQAAPPPPDYRPVDVGAEIREWEATPDRIAPMPAFDDEAAGADAATESLDDCILDMKMWLSLDNYTGFYFFTYFYLVAQSDNSQIWVQTDLSWPEGDPRETPVVTCEQAAYMVDEFDNNIHPTNTAFFGTPDPHDGSYSLLEAWGYFPPGYYYDEAGRQVVLVSNVRDANYYDPTYPYYIAGFYSPSFEAYFDRNIMSIDSYDWENRTGPDGARPYLYEGTFAHEFQHLIHDDVDPDEELWLNEGCSDFSEFLCGYGHPTSHVDSFATYPENSLVAWEDQGDLELLADYGHVYLWTLNLYEHFGGPFIQAMVNNPANGIESVDMTLADFGYDESFAEVYHKFAASLVTDPAYNGGGAYAFKNIVFQVDYMSPEAYDSPGAPPWGNDFIYIEDPQDVAALTFNGMDYTIYGTPWSSDGDVLYSGSGNLVDNWAIFEATGGGMLTFDTYYDIEDYWDFGFVQVSTDGGHTWTSLENADTTYLHDPSAHPKVVENLPGLTGWSGGWVPMSFDLSAYAGQDILIGFRYVTDWATLYEGWYIDNVYVDGDLISDGSSIDPFWDITQVVPINNDFTVQLIGAIARRNGTSFRVVPLPLDNMSEDGARENVSRIFQDSDFVVMVVTFDAPIGFTEYAEYDYEVIYNGTEMK